MIQLFSQTQPQRDNLGTMNSDKIRQMITLGTKKQAVFFEIFFLFLLSIFRLLHIIMVTTVYTEKIKEQFFNYQRKKCLLKSYGYSQPPIAPPPQNRKRGVDASFSFNFGLCLLMRRLSFTLRKKSFREFSLPIISKSSRDP